MNSVSAVVVPASRPGRHFREHIRLAESIGCPLVLLCSGHVTAQTFIEEARTSSSAIVAIDFDPSAGPLATQPFDASELLRGTPFQQRSDVSAKRNTALLLAHECGWDRVFFLDDDISIENSGDIRSAAGLLADYAAVGLTINGYPDGSVAAHAYRELGTPQRNFIGGGALMVAPHERISHFPEIYNDEWLYLIDDLAFPPMALTGSAVQDPYDPFLDPKRAVAEEFGEVIALGLHFCVEQGRAVRDADEEFWLGFLPSRRRLLDHLHDEYGKRVDQSPRNERIVLAIRSALDTFVHITPKFCTAYLHAWLRDRASWADRLAARPHGLSITEAMTDLGLRGLVPG